MRDLPGNAFARVNIVSPLKQLTRQFKFLLFGERAVKLLELFGVFIRNEIKFGVSIHVPERLADKVFGFAIVFFFFSAYNYIVIFHFYFLFDICRQIILIITKNNRNNLPELFI